jgi:hypothetical protein
VKCPAAPLTCSLRGYFAGVTYTQVLSPVALAQGSYEMAYLDGFQGNLYRNVPGIGVEKVPDHRMRNAFSVRGAYYFPSANIGLQLQYRYYFDDWPGSPAADPWLLHGHMIEGRVFLDLTRNLEVRLSYRQYFQSGADFWCDTLARPDCYVPGAPFYSSDVKLGPMHTEYPEIKLSWAAEALARAPFLRWFAAGTFDVSFGVYIQSDNYADARVLQLGYRMPY